MNEGTDEGMMQTPASGRLSWFPRTIATFAGVANRADDLSLDGPDFDAGDDRTRRTGFGWAACACVLTTAVAVALRGLLAPANLVMLYLLAVVLVTVRFGRKPGMLASFLAVLAFDLFLVPPYYSLTVAHTEYLFTFVIMLAVSLLISHLTADLRQHALIADFRERRVRALFELSRDLSAALTQEQIAEIGIRHIEAMLPARAALFIPDDADRLHALGGAHAAPPEPALMDRRTAQQVFEQSDTDAAGCATTPDGTLYLPLRAPMRTRGVLVAAPRTSGLVLAREQQRLVQTCASLIALAIERVHYADVAQAATVSIESERLRNSLLSAISHDIRTPLTAIVGLSSALSGERGERPLTPATRKELSEAIQENAIRMSSLVANLLDMARLHAGAVRLNRQWQMLEEVVGSALAMLARTLEGRRIEVALPAGFPLIEYDAVLMERVLCNLLDNAAKHTEPGGRIRIAAELAGAEALVAVEDDGPGVAAGMEEAIFAKFTRGEAESARPGVGLGLSICRSIVEAHGGRIWAESRADRSAGARIVFALPLGTPPAGAEHEDGKAADGDAAS